MFEVRNIAGAGRGCVALRDLSPGDIIVREEPFVMVPIINGRGAIATCIACFRQFSSAEVHPRCDGCGEHYCSTTCRDIYSPVAHHKWSECRALAICREQRSEVSVDDYNHLRAMVLLAVRAKMEGVEDVLALEAPRFRPKVIPEVDMVCSKLCKNSTDDNAPIATPSNSPAESGEAADSAAVPLQVATITPLLQTSSFAKSVAVLTSNVSSFGEDVIQTFQAISEAYDRLQEEHDEFLPVFSSHMFVKISCAYQCNGFSLWCDEQRKSDEETGKATVLTSTKDHEVASGFFGHAAMINHSCAPNAHKKFVGRELQFEVTRAVKAGDQIYLSYVDKNMSFNLRQWRLSTQYFFDCRCSRCSAELEKIGGGSKSKQR